MEKNKSITTPDYFKFISDFICDGCEGNCEGINFKCHWHMIQLAAIMHDKAIEKRNMIDNDSMQEQKIL